MVASPRLPTTTGRARRRLFFNIAVRVELTHVSPQIFGLLLVLDAWKDHFGAGDLRLGILYVLLEPPPFSVDDDDNEWLVLESLPTI
jgi:hypothetical protein